MNENFKWIAAAVAVVGLSVGAVLYVSHRPRPAPEPEPLAAAPASAEPAPVEDPTIPRNPLPASDSTEALPDLDGSDALMKGALTDLLGPESVERFVVPEQLIRHIVVSIDNLPDQKVAERIRPLKRVPGEFAVAGTEEARVLDPANFERYEVLVKLLSTLDTTKLVATYSRYYPLFQEAYESLGHPPQHFNDRLVEVIDHLLATPDIHEPIALAQPGVLYTFADPALETRSAGQKMLIRMGPDHAAAIKAKLRELRTALKAQAPRN
jgi:hypothetical protein